MSRGRTILAAVAVMIAAVGVTTVSAGATTTVGSISGTVYNSASTPAPLAGICVSIGGGSPVTVPTTSTGTYQLNNVPSGLHHVQAFDCHGGAMSWLTTWYTGSTAGSANESDATAVNVPAGGVASALDFHLKQSGAISGTTFDNASNAIGGICVVASDANGRGTLTTSATTSPVGAYQLNNLAPGKYTVSFNNCPMSGNGYAPQYYNGAPSLYGATPVPVSSAVNTSGINARLVPSGTITGTVTDNATTPAPIAGICVSATDNAGHFGSATSQADGTYKMANIAPATYKVSFSDCGHSVYVAQFFQGAKSQVDATPVTVAPGATVPNVSAHMVKGGTVSGTVTDTASTPNPLANVCVSVNDGLGHLGSATTSATGTYSIGGLATAKYEVRFGDCSYPQVHVPQYYSNAATPQMAAPLAVTAGATSTANAKLVTGSTINGTVTDTASTPNPLGNVCVTASDGLGHYGYTTTSSTGSYSITGLAASKYEISFRDCQYPQVHLPQFYPNAATQEAASPLTLTAGGTATANAKMVTGGTISGTVTDNSGTPAPLSGVCVSAYDGGSNYGSANTVSGSYTMSGLAPGKYQVTFSDCSNSGYLTQYFNGATNSVMATPVTVAAGATTSSINAKMAPGRTISGTTFDNSSTPVPISGICTSAYKTDGTFIGSSYGAFSTTYNIRGLAPGTYRVAFYDCMNHGYLPQYYKNSATELGSIVVDVTTANATGIDAHMVLGGKITGTVSNSAGPLSGICVQAVGGTASYGRTDGSGHYTLSGLAAGKYDVEFYDCSMGGHGTQWYKGVPTQDGATPVSVTAGGTATLVDGHLT